MIHNFCNFLNLHLEEDCNESGGSDCYSVCFRNILRFESRWLKDNYTYFSSKFMSGEHSELCELFVNFKGRNWLPCQRYCKNTHTGNLLVMLYNSYIYITNFFISKLQKNKILNKYNCFLIVSVCG